MKSTTLPELNLEKLLQGKVMFGPSFRVSKKSVFSDGIFDFNDDKVIRLNSVAACCLRLDWDSFATGSEENDVDGKGTILLPLEIIHELKILTVLYHRVPSAFSGFNNRKLKPQTVVAVVRGLARFLSAIYRVSLFAGLGATHRLSHITSISAITLSDITQALETTPFVDGTTLKRALGLLTTPVMSRHLLEGPVNWNRHDLKSLNFRYAEERRDYNPVMPNELFRFLSNTACADILGFLQLLGIDSADKTTTNINLGIAKDVVNGKQMFEDYVAIRLKDREYAAKLGKKSNNSSLERKKFARDYGISVKDFLALIYRVQRASYAIIGLYTGARYSDLTSFRTGCIEKHHGIYVLRGTLGKFEDIAKQENNDLWPAIPIMRDALRCLEEISRVTFNPYLISGRDTVPEGETPKPMTLTGLTTAINNYLDEIDVSRRWVDWRTHPHQLRHTLANQLARADVGLTYIAHQMKHLYTALSALPPAATLIYGRIGDIKTQRAMQMPAAHLEVASELFNPDSPVAGGGADAFKKRRRAYFEGMAAQGWTKDEVIEHLSRQGLPFASVGLAYCGGKRESLFKAHQEQLSMSRDELHRWKQKYDAEVDKVKKLEPIVDVLKKRIAILENELTVLRMQANNNVLKLVAPIRDKIERPEC